MNKLEKKTKSPNLVYIFADQLRAQSCGYMGDKKAHTPNIDKLAEEGVNFCNAVSVTPLCCPYRASLFTGQHTSSTGMVINELRMRTDQKCLAQVLNDAGYKSAYIGKWHLWAKEPKPPDNPGKFHSNPENQFVPPGVNRLGFDDYWAAYNFNHRYYKGFYYKDEFKRIDINDYQPDVMTELAIDYIDKATKRTEPFNLFVSYGTPHQPWSWNNVPEKFSKLFRNLDFPLPLNYEQGSAEYWHSRFDRKWWRKNIEPNLNEYQQIYYAMTANLDWNVGRLLDAIDKQGLRDDTIIVFTSDHGEMFGAHGRVQKNIFYEEAARIPFLIRWPGNIPPGLTADVCLNTPDIMPTLLSLMEQPIPKSVEGMDFSHAALGLSGPEPEAAFMQGMGASVDWDDGFEWRALRDKRYTYALMRADGTEYLYDHRFDSYQIRNLKDSEEHRDTLEHFRNLIKEKMSELNDTFERLNWYREKWINARYLIYK